MKINFLSLNSKEVELECAKKLVELLENPPKDIPETQVPLPTPSYKEHTNPIAAMNPNNIHNMDSLMRPQMKNPIQPPVPNPMHYPLPMPHPHPMMNPIQRSKIKTK